MTDFKKLRAWQRAHVLAVRLHVLTQAFPDDERYGLTSQLRRAATSIPANIAEGSKRSSATEYARFLNIAQGSAAETEYFLLFARDLGYQSVELTAELLEEVDHVSRMLHALRVKVEAGRPKGAPGRRNPARSTPDSQRSTHRAA